MNPIFNVKIKGLEELKRSFNSAPEIVGPILQKGIVISSQILSINTDSANGGGSVPYRTGGLIQSFRSDVQPLRARWFPTVYYAPYVEFGHRQEVGRYVPAIKKRLVQPFVKKNPFMERIRNRSKDQINNVFMSALKEITRVLSTQT